MMARQLITVHKTGGVSGLDHKRDGLDLAKLGRAKKQRASEIVWNIGAQQWMVNLLHKEGGEIATIHTAILAGVEKQIPNCALSQGTGVLLFNDYEDAVKAEIAILQGLQSKGLL